MHHFDVNNKAKGVEALIKNLIRYSLCLDLEERRGARITRILNDY